MLLKYFAKIHQFGLREGGTPPSRVIAAWCQGVDRGGCGHIAQYISVFQYISCIWIIKDALLARPPCEYLPTELS